MASWSDEKIIGTCGNCGGPVVKPRISPSSPYCRDCGASVKRGYGPVIPMEPRPWRCRPRLPYQDWPFDWFNDIIC